MKRVVASALVWFVVLAVGLESPAQAVLRYAADQTSDGSRFIMVEGEFEFRDNLDEFANAVRSHNPIAILFNSPGGNVAKAMELGRMIRSFGLSTIQSRGLECASACALAFLGGESRYAEPGSIGMHKSSFSGEAGLNVDQAVAAVQQLTADVMTYMSDMGADPTVLQLSLKYDSDDIRYLSRSEMEQYRVITDGAPSAQSAPTPAGPQPPVEPQPRIAALPQADPRSGPALSIPEARSGRVRHPTGKASLKAAPDSKSANLRNFGNGTPVDIVGSTGRWYRVRALGETGYMHDSWVYVDQFASGPFYERHIQLKSFDNFADAEAFVRSTSVPLAAYLATNNWFAVTFAGTFDRQDALQIVGKLKAEGSIPDDAFVTSGNTYVRKVCCN